MANSTRRKAPANKSPAKKPVTDVDESQVQTVSLVAPMHQDAFRMAMAIVNEASIKGSNAESVVLLKRELARVAGQQIGQPRS